MDHRVVLGHNMGSSERRITHFSVTRIKTYDLNVLRAYICIQGSFKLVYIFMRQKLENVLGIVLYFFVSRAVFTLLG